ncbi:hypothetical protein [Paenibacillus dokdonensis]|uniref:hypothetical protein n=1 Tax=Paenibacillus dokdonensis TaxID=2567944 RepID=UPI0010A7EEB4|nr:hypothetical protein [Paenibacillus dokdonensis]
MVDKVVTGTLLPAKVSQSRVAVVCAIRIIHSKGYKKAAKAMAAVISVCGQYIDESLRESLLHHPAAVHAL